MSERPRFYKRRSVRIGAAAVAIPVLAAAWWLGSPLFIDEVVDEPFPRAAMAIVPDDMTAEEVEKEMIEAEGAGTPAYEDMPETGTVMTTGAPDTTTTSPTTAGAPADADRESTEATTTPTTEEPPPEQDRQQEEPSTPQHRGPVALAAGALMDGDSFHKGSGRVVLYRLEDGSHLVRLEDIEVTNGPDLHVLLTPVHGVEGRDDLHAAGYIDLGSLKGNIGSQNYEVPPDYEIPPELTLVIYCVPFHVVFATAPLT